MLLNEKLNDTAQRILWKDTVHTCKPVRNSMATTGSMKIPFEILYGDKQNIIGLLSEFGSISYVAKRDKIKKLMTDNMENSIMVRYTDNHTRYAYRLFNPERKRVIITRDVNWVE